MPEYIENKIKLLKQLKIKLSAAQLKHIKSLTTEIAVDNFAHDLIFDKGTSLSVTSNKRIKYLGSTRGVML